MGSLYLFLVAVMFSCGGTCCKLIGPYFSSEYITLFRFVIGVSCLLVLKGIQHFTQPNKQKTDYRAQFRSCWGWLVLGAASKAISYLAENYGLTHGVSYGNILVSPVQTIFLTMMSAILLHEKLAGRKALFIVPCVLGVLIVSWNGRSLDSFLNESAVNTLLFVVTGIFGGAHVLAQKKVSDRMDIVNSNLTMFSIAAVISLFPVISPTMNGALVGIQPDWKCFAGILAYGFITGIGFYLNAKAIPLVPFYMVPIIQSASAIFSITWGVIFFNEPLSVWIVGGTAIFVFGIVGLQLAGNRKT